MQHCEQEKHSALETFANVSRYTNGKHFRRKNLAVVQLTSELGGEWSADKQTKANPRSRPFSTFSLFLKHHRLERRRRISLRLSCVSPVSSSLVKVFDAIGSSSFPNFISMLNALVDYFSDDLDLLVQ